MITSVVFATAQTSANRSKRFRARQQGFRRRFESRRPLDSNPSEAGQQHGNILSIEQELRGIQGRARREPGTTWLCAGGPLPGHPDRDFLCVGISDRRNTGK